MLRKKIVALCVFLIGLVFMLGCATIQAVDNAIANSIARSSAEKAATASDQQTEQLSPASVNAQTVRIKEAFASANVRAEPSKQAAIVTTLPGGMEVEKEGESAGWIQVRVVMEDGSEKTGWVDESLTEK